MAIRINDRETRHVRELNNLFDCVEIKDDVVIATTYLGQAMVYPRQNVDIEIGRYEQVMEKSDGSIFIRRS